MNSITSSGTTVGSTITLNLANETAMRAGDTLYIQNCPDSGYNGQYTIDTVDGTSMIVTVTAANALASTSIAGFALSQTNVWSPVVDSGTNYESVLLHVYNYKPDSVLLSDPNVLPWLQEYALAFCKSILGQARGKFSNIVGPQGGTQLNGATLMQEAQAEMEKLEMDLKNYVDGSMPLTWITG
jgi:hypothetical protein